MIEDYIDRLHVIEDNYMKNTKDYIDRLYC